MVNPTIAARKLLDVGEYLCELSQRLKAFEMCRNVRDMDMVQKFEEFLQNFAIEPRKFDTKTMTEKLHEMLKAIIYCYVDNGKYPAGNKKHFLEGKELAKEIGNVKAQMHRNNLAKTIVANSGKKWEHLGEKWQNHILSQLFDRKENNKNLTKKFREHLEGWKKLRNQEEIGNIKNNLEKIEYFTIQIKHQFSNLKNIYTKITPEETLIS